MKKTINSIIVCYLLVVTSGRRVHIRHCQAGQHVSTHPCHSMGFSASNMDLVQYWFVHRLMYIYQINSIVRNRLINFTKNKSAIFMRTHTPVCRASNKAHSFDVNNSKCLDMSTSAMD